MAAVFWGPASDRYGRRYIMLVGNGILVVGAVGCAFALTFQMLLMFRVIQGIGAATSAVVTSAIIADVYSSDRAVRLYGLMNAVFTIIMAISPILGGVLNTVVGWRGSYGAVAVISIISWGALYFFLPETKLLTGRIISDKTMVNYRRLLSSSLFLSAAIIPSLFYGCYISFVAVAPFIYMQVFEVGMLMYTLHQGVIVLFFAITSMYSSQIIQLLGKKRALHLALFVAGVGSGLMFYLNTIGAITFAMSLFSVGFALLYPTIFASSLEIFPDMKGLASSVIISLRYFICAGITAIVSYFYNGDLLILPIVFSGVMVLILVLSLRVLSHIRL